MYPLPPTHNRSRHSGGEISERLRQPWPHKIAPAGRKIAIAEERSPPSVCLPGSLSAEAPRMSPTVAVRRAKRNIAGTAGWSSSGS